MASLSFVQRLAKAFTSAERFAAMEAESRAWIAKCPNCGSERSIWALGGIRYKAAGNPQRRMRCRNCGEAGWHEVAKTRGR
jgi:transposase-like protein